MLALALLAAAGVGYWVRGRAPRVATVTRTQGDVRRDFVGREARWKPAARGDALYLGDAARTGSEATAALALNDGATLTMAPNTLIRFSSTRPDAASFRLEAGEAVLQSGPTHIGIETAFGLITLQAKASLRLQHRPSGIHLRVEMGRAIFVDLAGSSQSIAAGGELSVEHSAAPREQSAALQGVSGEDPALLASTQLREGGPVRAPPGQAEPGLKPRPAAARQRPDLPVPPARAEVSLPAGESATVHHPREASSVRIRFGQRCPHGEGFVELATGRQRFHLRAIASDQALVNLASGETRYRVRCVPPGRETGKVVASGRIRVLRDLAIRRVPLQPPSNAVDLDGRRYTLLYQNRLPALVLRMPDGEPVERVIIKSGSQLRSLPATGASYRMASGELSDGRHEIHVARADGSKLPSTTLNIAFDNAAPMAYLDQRGLLDRDGAGPIPLSGVVPLGSRVTLDGRNVAVDGKGRFATSISPEPQEAGVALRVEHPRGGVHYYVRQLTEPGVE